MTDEPTTPTEEDISENSIEEMLRARGAVTVEPPADAPPEDPAPPAEEAPEVPSEEPTQPEEETPLSAPPEGLTEVPAFTFTDDEGNTSTLTRDEAQRLLEFQNLITSDQNLYNSVTSAVDQHFAALTAPAAPPEPPPLPEGLDADDPAVAYFQSLLAAEQAKYDALQSQLTSHEQQLSAQTEASVTSLINRAKDSFAKEHNLTAADVDKVYAITEQVINIPALVQSATDPFTGATQRSDPLTAIEQGMLAAMRAVPEFYQRELDAEIARRTEDQARKAKLNSLGGGTSPAQPEADVSKNPREALNSEVRRMMEGNFVSPETGS